MIRSEISLAPEILIRTASQIRAAPVPLWRPREPLQTYLTSIMTRLAGLALFWSRTNHSCACLFLKSSTPSMSSHSAIRPTVRRIRNALELVPPQPVRRNHIRVRKGLGQVHRSPKKKRSQAHHAVTVTCSLKSARRKALQERFNRLKENSSEDTDKFESAAEVSHEDPMDLDKDYVDVDDQPRESHKHKRDTKEEAQRLYEAWQRLLPSLVLPFLAYLNKSASRPTANTFEPDDSSPCTTCTSDTHKTTRILCLFWDRKEYSLSNCFVV
jgi:hypothetical protein